MRELYRQVGNPNSREDIGEDGFVNAYHGSLIFKRLVIYILECGYGANGGKMWKGQGSKDRCAICWKAGHTTEKCWFNTKGQEKGKGRKQ